jgi:hypothetical protein
MGKVRSEGDVCTKRSDAAKQTKECVPELPADKEVIWYVGAMKLECKILHNANCGCDGCANLHHRSYFVVEWIVVVVYAKHETRRGI